jgi:serine/threonine protein kinase/tetratricopeptide (TPR) repeat protein
MTAIPVAIGPYRIRREIGRGGMGVVYEGWDERLARAVALKTILRASEPQMRERFIREARAAAAVSHPNICQLFDIGEHEGEPFLCMELLDGESLAERVARGPMAVPDAANTQLAILSALSALHRRGIVHRDLKPTNIFLSASGVKLLDFGLARSVAAVSLQETSVTMPGIVMGSPRYMAPEQVRGDDVDARTDIFTAGLVLFEMLSGRAAFGGTSAVDVLHAVTHEHPPALMGSPAVVDMDRIIQRAVAKAREDRYQGADEMATEVRAALSRAGAGDTARALATRRLAVLPFKVLRPDPAVDFLAFSLPDAITVALSALDSLTVRSSLAAARFSEGVPDLRAIASELSVEAAITGTLLHAANAVRVAVQLVEVPSGTVRWSHTAQVPLDDLFTIQDSVCSAVVDAFALKLTKKEHAALRQDVPASPEAYEHYLRANRLSTTAMDWPLARDLYIRAVEADPSYAPAWARLGRVQRNIGKYGRTAETRDQYQRAEAAFQRAFALNPELPLAHNLYTYMEVETGRAQDAMLRLLGRLKTRTHDPDLFAGLVQACRYVGLLDASVAAYHRATRLDPAIVTSVAHSFFMLGQYQRATETDLSQPPYVSLIAHLALGQSKEAAALCDAARAHAGAHPHVELMMRLFECLLTGKLEDGRQALGSLKDYSGFSDPEGWYYWGQAAALVEDRDYAMELLTRAVSDGFACPRALETTPMLDPLRGSQQFAELMARARDAHEAPAWCSCGASATHAAPHWSVRGAPAPAR